MDSGIVQAKTYISLSAVPRGATFQAAVVADIARGFHMNSHTPSEAYLIATTLTPRLPAGIKLVSTDYPPGHAAKLAFSTDKPLDVYSDRATFRLQLAASAAAPLGVTTIPVVLRYQACNQTTCFPPVRLPLEIRFEVVKADAQASATHPEIFTVPPAR
jgi:thiol:disulfide interchange protein DsbD